MWLRACYIHGAMSNLACHLDDVDRVIAEYPDLPPEAVIKEDLLRLGMAFS